MPSIEFDKKTRKTICRPSTKDIIVSLSDAPAWCKILCTHTNENYKDVLVQLIAEDFFRKDERLVVGKIAKEFKMDTAKLHKLISRIYDDIFDLNEATPDLFEQPGIPHNLQLKYFDSHCNANVWLPATPRLYETVVFDFVNAKVGTTHFTVMKVMHEVNDINSGITLFLEGGNINPYRQRLINRALFEQKIGLYDTWHLPEHKLDEELRKLYK